MKCILTTALLLFFSLAAKSQWDKGTWLAGGAGSFYSYTEAFSSADYSSEAKYTEIDLSPSVGYFLADKLAVGLRPTFSSIKGEVTTASGARSNTRQYWIEPFARYYLLSKDRTSNIVTDVRYQLGVTTFDNKNIGSLETFGASAGPVVYFNSSVALEVLLGYTYNKADNDDAYKSVRKGFEVSVGFQIHLSND